jgi:nitrogen fixation protein FixH
MKCATFVLLLLAISMTLSTCGEITSPNFTQTAGSLSATLNVVPDPPVPMEETTLELTVRNADGQPVVGADVRFDLTMPAMEMPPNRPEATEEENGVYRAQALFTMAGEWQILAEISSPGQSERFTFLLNTR